MYKIGILTFSFSINYGAFLQAYALQKAINFRYKNFVKAEIVNYNSKRAIDYYRSDDLLYEAKYKLFERSWETFLLSGDLLVSDDLEEVAKYIKSKEYDMVIVGSDQVWMIEGFRGFPNAYWLNYDIGNSIRVAYAVSGRENIKNFGKEVYTYVKEAIHKFDYIGVRDYITQKNIKELTDKKVYVNCDPTFLVADFFSMPKKNGRKKKRILLLIYSYPELANKMYRMLRNEFEVVNAYDKYGKNTDVNSFCVGPFEWIELIASADLVITDRFHGTVLSIINHVPFVSLDREKDNCGKISDLLFRNNLESQLIYLDSSHLLDNSFSMDLYTKSRTILLTKTSIDFDETIKNEQSLANSFFAYLDAVVI